MIRFLFVAVLLIAPSATAAQDFSPIRHFLKKAVDEGTVAGGSILVLQRGKVVFGEGFGYADQKSKTIFQLDTPVVIASISKPLLGTAAFRLAENGKFDLSRPITDYLPEFESSVLESGVKLERAPTTLELFTHTSGMRHDEADGGRPWFESWPLGKPLDQVVTHFADEFPFKAQPGTRYAYSGIGTDVAARVMEVVAKRNRNDLFVAEVAKPLGMNHTFYRDAESIKLIGPMPTRYERAKDRDKDGTLRVSRKRPLPKPNTYSASGGTIISTAPDLAHWLLMIRNQGQHDGKAYLAPKAVAEMLAPYPGSQNAKGGLMIRKKNHKGKPIVVGHTGSSGTDCWVDFDKDLIVILLTQTEEIREFRLELQDLVYETFTSPEESQSSDVRTKRAP